MVMTEPGTKAFLQNLSNRANEEPCDCKYCTEERKKGISGVPFPSSSLQQGATATNTITVRNASSNNKSDPMTEALKKLVQENNDKLKRLQGRCNDEPPSMYDKTIPEPPSNFHPELSSNPRDWDYSKRHTKKV